MTAAPVSSVPPASAGRSTLIYGLAAVGLGFSLPVTSAAIDNLFVFLLLFAFIAGGQWHDKAARLRHSGTVLAITAFLVLALLGTLWGYGSSGERARFFGKYAILLLPLCLIAFPLEEKYRRRAAIAFGSAIGLTVLLSFAIRAGLHFPEWLIRNQDAANPVVFKLHITHSFFVALGAFLFFVSALHARTPLWRWGLGAASVVAVANLFTVQGRTGHLVLLVLVAYIFVHRFRWRGVVSAAILLAGVGVIMSQLPNNPLVSRYSDGIKEIREWQYGQNDRTSMGLRMQYAATSLRIIAEHPLTGVGTGGFTEAYRQQIIGTEIAESNNPHNQYLLTTAQLGIPGLVVLLALFVTLWRVASRLSPAEQLLARGLLLAYGVGNLFNSFMLDHTEKVLFAWAIGLLYSGLPAATNRDGQIASGR